MKQPLPKLDNCLVNAAIAFVIMFIALDLVHFALVRAELIEPRSTASCDTGAAPDRPRTVCSPAPGNPLGCQGFDPTMPTKE